MTDTATEPLDVTITHRLQNALAPSHLAVSNDSAQHRGHMGDDGTGETHFSVDIVSDAFAGLNRVARQRLVNNALADLLSTRIHALAMRTRAPGE
ncbi:BolA family protein [Sphingomonas mollis]|uniref:BolA family transcriptional regulator n=1 Tax=Sphingomonas mollis TaxID=2795726 RepID=A0ABS0XT29_9SPHN|nr:BolA family protein [Sphingomonas sp. BT553]MBJ6122910.1 BolA family transcriptional regulator [Sphingomonas sp. BT553]